MCIFDDCRYSSQCDFIDLTNEPDNGDEHFSEAMNYISPQMQDFVVPVRENEIWARRNYKPPKELEHFIGVEEERQISQQARPHRSKAQREAEQRTRAKRRAFAKEAQAWQNMLLRKSRVAHMIHPKPPPKLGFTHTNSAHVRYAILSEDELRLPLSHLPAKLDRPAGPASEHHSFRDSMSKQSRRSRHVVRKRKQNGDHVVRVRCENEGENDKVMDEDLWKIGVGTAF
ncbi:hypothetical protein EK21DRAFT_85566 [Setomelanomma holmii]|uniref:Uncharacterized protein n=1 Tax=Setomelanomma holmii TaxID=210430 RepID=A0A9P4HJG5_9PLEO|nr:hypothetical protein EK21DRAFT_85566 [Setomelanomma holmii]